MSIFFYHVLLTIFPLSLILSFLDCKNHIKSVFLTSILGILFGFLCFSAFSITASTDQAKIFFDSLVLITLLILPLNLIIKNNYFVASVSFLLATGYAYSYKFISMNFKIFAGELLDSLSLTNLFMVCFGFLILIGIYFLMKSILKSVNKKLKISFLVILIIYLIIDRIGFIGLSCMQEGIIPTYGELLSVVAKILYVNDFIPITLSIFIIILALNTILRLPKMPKYNDGVINFRIIKSIRNKISREFFYAILFALIMSSISLYYILVASKPPKIDDPIIVEPIDGEFKFDANIVKDNKLHRFAYITDDGHKVRFFLLNRFADKLAPVAVFDSCSICGDMGYVKKGDELICISCNVRIFLPSVGKEGGCNPIPFEYKFNGKDIIIPFDSIQGGATYFSEIVTKEVLDPVSRKKIMNTSPNSYLYYGRTYFFENEKNQAEFEANPEKYVTTKGVYKELK